MLDAGGRKTKPATAAAIAAGHRRRSGISSAAASLAAQSNVEQRASPGSYQGVSQFEQNNSASIAEAGRMKYGKLLSAGSDESTNSVAPKLHVEDHKITDSASLVSHSSEEGRQKLLFNHLHEIRRFDSADYFTGHLPEEILAGHIGEGDDDEEDVSMDPTAITGSAEQQRLMAKQMLMSKEGRRRWGDQSNTSRQRTTGASNPPPEQAVSSVSVAKRLLMANKRTTNRVPPPSTRKPATSKLVRESTAPNPKYGSLGIAAGRQVMLRRALKEKPTLQRWDSGEYFQHHKLAEGSPVHPAPGQPPEAPPLDPTDQGRQLLLARKLKEVKRFDSGDYFRGLSQKTTDDGSSISSLSAPDTDSFDYRWSPEPADDGFADRDAQQVVAQRLIGDRKQRWDSADYSMGLQAQRSGERRAQAEALPAPPRRRYSGNDRAERRMLKYGKLSAKPKQTLPP